MNINSFEDFCDSHLEYFDWEDECKKREERIRRMEDKEIDEDYDGL